MLWRKRVFKQFLFSASVNMFCQKLRTRFVEKRSNINFSENHLQVWIIKNVCETTSLSIRRLRDCELHSLLQGPPRRGPRSYFVWLAMLFGNFQIINICVAKYLEKRCSEIIESNLNDAQCGLPPGRSTTEQQRRQNIHSQANFWEILRGCQRRHTCFVFLEKACDRAPREKFWGKLREYCVDGRLLLAVTSLHFCSEVCDHVGKVKSRLFTVGVGLRQECFVVTTSLRSLHKFDRHSQPSRRGCRSWELQDQPFTSCRQYGAASIFSTESSASTRPVFCCV